MPFHAHGEQRDRIVLDVEHGLVVVGPGQRGGGIFEFVGQYLARGEILEVDRELTSSDHVVAIGEQLFVRADFKAGDLKEVVSCRQRRAVEHDLLGTVFAAFARVDRILFAFLESDVVPVILVLRRHARIVLLDAADDLVVDRIFERFVVRGHRRVVIVLRLDVAQHRRIGARVVA